MALQRCGSYSGSKGGGSLEELDARGSLDARGVGEVINLLNAPDCSLRRLILPGCDALRHLDDGFGALAAALAVNTSVEKLQLGCSYINTDGAVSIAGALRSNTKLEVLELQHNPLLDQGCAALGMALATNTSLRSLQLPFTGLGDGACSALALALRGGSALESLSLSGNNVTAAGFEALAQALSSGRLITLDLSANQHLGARGALALAAALPKASTLRTLNLDGCAVGASPCSRLAAAIAASTITSLDLSDNEIGDEGAWELAWRLPECPALRHLGLAVNNIEEDGGVEFLPALAAGTGLTSLDLRGNRIDPTSTTHSALAATGLANVRFQRAAPWRPRHPS